MNDTGPARAIGAFDNFRRYTPKTPSDLKLLGTTEPFGLDLFCQLYIKYVEIKVRNLHGFVSVIKPRFFWQIADTR